MTTNESLFFRDQKPFDLLKDRVIPDLMQARAAERRLRIWSAAASTGQEAFSIGMTLLENFPQLASWDIQILGTDYSPQVVERARKGEFNHFEVQRGMPIMLLMKYFSQEGEAWKVNDSLKKNIRFQEGNLLTNFSHLGPFDLIFCRNVLIYFDADTKKDVLERLSRVMSSDGYLFLGASETVFGLTDTLRPVDGANTTLYERTDGVRARAAV
jgi:chemotaxis protein methyltransferase CheR